MWTKLLSVALAIALVVSLNLNREQQKSIDELRARPPSTPSDEVFIRYAAALWAAKNRTTVDKILKDEYGTVVQFPDKACVSLHVELGGVGGVPVYCFAKTTGSLVWKFDDVE